MSFQDSNQQPYPPPQQGWGQQEQQQPQQQAPAGSWGAPGQAPAPDGSGQGWGSQQPQMPQQPGWGFGQGGAPEQSFGQSQGYGQQNFAQPGYPQQQAPQQPPQQQPFVPQQGGYPGGYGSGPVGYPQQSDFGSGAGYGPGPGYPSPGPQQNSGLATAALWIGIFFGWGVVGLVVSILGINDTGPGKKAGRGKAITGLCLTLAWAVVFFGISLALAHHDSSVALSGAPSDTVTTSATTGAGSGATSGAVGGASTAAAGSGSGTGTTTGGVPTSGATADLYVTGATDPGCVTVQTAINNLASKNANAYSDFVTALQTGASQSQTASSQIAAVAADFDGSSGTPTEAKIRTDMAAMDSACGMTGTTTDPN